MSDTINEQSVANGKATKESFFQKMGMTFWKGFVCGFFAFAFLAALIKIID